VLTACQVFRLQTAIPSSCGRSAISIVSWIGLPSLFDDLCCLVGYSVEQRGAVGLLETIPIYREMQTATESVRKVMLLERSGCYVRCRVNEMLLQCAVQCRTDIRLFILQLQLKYTQCQQDPLLYRIVPLPIWSVYIHTHPVLCPVTRD